MTEFEKMRNEEFYDFTSEECLASYYRAKHICACRPTASSRWPLTIPTFNPM